MNSLFDYSGKVGGMLGSDIMSVEFFKDQEPVVNDRYVPWVASPLEMDPGPSPQLDKVGQFFLSLYICIYIYIYIYIYCF